MPKQPRDPENVRNGRVFRELRETRGLRPRQLAVQLDVSVNLIYAIEYGDRRITNVVAHRAARYFNVPVSVIRPDLSAQPADEDEEPELAAAS